MDSSTIFNNKMTAGSENSEADDEIKQALLKVYKIFLKKTADEKLKKEVSDIKNELMEVQAEVSKCQLEKIIKLESSIAAKDEVILKQAKEIEQIAVLQAKCAEKDSSIALLRKEKADLLTAQTQTPSEVRIIQINQWMQRSKVQCNTIENLKYDKGAAFINLAKTKEKLEKCEADNRSFIYRVEGMTKSLAKYAQEEGNQSLDPSDCSDYSDEENDKNCVSSVSNEQKVVQEIKITASII